MELIINVPINMLEYFVHQESFLLLSHLMNNPEYFDFFKSRPRQRLIFDNSAFELGSPSYEGLEEAIEVLKITDVVAPDVPFDAKQTYLLTKPFVKRIRENYPNLKIIGVLQGSSMKDVTECAKRLLDLDIDIVAIPKRCGVKFAHVLLYKATLSRYRVFAELLEIMDKWSRKLPIHLLGLNSPEVEIPAYRSCVDSLDTSYPFRSLVRDFSYEKEFPEGLIGEALQKVGYLQSLLTGEHGELMSL